MMTMAIRHRMTLVRRAMKELAAHRPRNPLRNQPLRRLRVKPNPIRVTMMQAARAARRRHQLQAPARKRAGPLKQKKALERLRAQNRKRLIRQMELMQNPKAKVMTLPRCQGKAMRPNLVNSPALRKLLNKKLATPKQSPSVRLLTPF